MPARGIRRKEHVVGGGGWLGRRRLGLGGGTIAQWLFFISDIKYYPKSLYGLCSVRVLVLNDPSGY